MLTAAELSAQGALILEFLDSADWVARRVETVRFLDSTRLERRVTLDINRGRLAEVAARHPAAVNDGRILVPVALLAKGLLLDLDLRGNDEPLQVATSDVDSQAAAAALVRTLADEGVDVTKLPQSILSTILEVTKCSPSEQDVKVLNGESPDIKTVDAWKLEKDLHGNYEAETKQWRDLLSTYDSFWSRLGTFTLLFMLMTEVEVDNCPGIIKYRYVETQDLPDMDVNERLGLEPFVTLVEAPGVASATREHIRIEAPPGVLFEDAYLWTLDERLPLGMDALPPAGIDRKYQRRVTQGRVAIYTAGMAQGNFAVALSMRANPTGFLRRSQYVIALAFFLLASGAIADVLWNTLGDIQNDQTDPTVALMLLVPTFLVAYVAREGDHQILGDLLRAPRFVVASTGLATLLSATALVAGVEDWWLTGLWIGAAVLCLAVLYWLRTVNHRVRVALDRVLPRQGQTETLPLTVFVPA